jgi:hypothetical protein
VAEVVQQLAGGRSSLSNSVLLADEAARHGHLKEGQDVQEVAPQVAPTALTGRRELWHNSQFPPRSAEAKAKIRVVCPVNLAGKKCMDTTCGNKHPDMCKRKIPKNVCKLWHMHPPPHKDQGNSNGRRTAAPPLTATGVVAAAEAGATSPSTGPCSCQSLPSGRRWRKRSCRLTCARPGWSARELLWAEAVMPPAKPPRSARQPDMDLFMQAMYAEGRQALGDSKAGPKKVLGPPAAKIWALLCLMILKADNLTHYGR